MSIKPIVASVWQMIEPHAEKISIAGSLRRGKQKVKDVELVVIPDDNLLHMMNIWAKKGTIQKAPYGKNGTHRWGSKYRGFIHQGVRFEMFTATPDTWGYILWLRTGPADAGHYVMGHMKRYNAPYRFDNGACWLSEKATQQVSVPEEATLFELLGINEWVSPQNRTVQLYKDKMYRRGWVAKEALTLVPDPQLRLF